MSYAQRNKWLVDIQNTSTLTGEKLKIKFSSLKLTDPLDEFVRFDTHLKDFIVILDDLTTANMDPWIAVSSSNALKVTPLLACSGDCVTKTCFEAMSDSKFYPPACQVLETVSP